MIFRALAFSYCSFRASEAVFPAAIAFEKVYISLKEASFYSSASNP